MQLARNQRPTGQPRTACTALGADAAVTACGPSGGKGPPGAAGVGLGLLGASAAGLGTRTVRGLASLRGHGLCGVQPKPTHRAGRAGLFPLPPSPPRRQLQHVQRPRGSF